jgi:hypothetical protein
MRYRLVSILAFIVFLANSSISSVAKAACKDHEYHTECDLHLGQWHRQKNPTSVAKDWVRVAE